MQIDQTRKNKIDREIPAREVAYVVVLLCAGLKRLAEQRSLEEGGDQQIAKISTITSNEADIDRRLAEIGADRYGAAVVLPDGSVRIEPGFERWVTGTILPSRPARCEEIDLLPRAIAVTLPPGLTRRRFDLAVRNALAGRALTYSGAQLPRRTEYLIGATKRLSMCTELFRYAHRSSEDANILLAAVEFVVLRHKRLFRPTPY